MSVALLANKRRRSATFTWREMDFPPVNIHYNVEGAGDVEGVIETTVVMREE